MTHRGDTALDNLHDAYGTCSFCDGDGETSSVPISPLHLVFGHFSLASIKVYHPSFILPSLPPDSSLPHQPFWTGEPSTRNFRVLLGVSGTRLGAKRLFLRPQAISPAAPVQGLRSGRKDGRDHPSASVAHRNLLL